MDQPLVVFILLSSVYGFASSLTCDYNGVKYNEGDVLPTRGQCLDCVCKEGFTEPGTPQCTIIDCPQEWKSDCAPTYAQDECCPISWNCTVSSGVIPVPDPSAGECNCPWRYFKHYAALGCKPIYEGDNVCCPVRFDCPEKPNVDQSVCHRDGKTYNIGEELLGGCTPCTCRENWQDPTKAQITCAADGCSNLMNPDPRLRDGRCYEVYEQDQCCPTGVKCDYDAHDETNKLICTVNGKIYHNGQKIYPEGMPCTQCYCNANFTGVHGKTCTQTNCNLENELSDLQQGCLPIYHEATCCPIEWHCRTGDETIIPSKNSLPSSAESSDDKHKCMFDGKSYSVGDVMDIHHGTGCVNCTCIAPPHLTCVHKQCPPSPHNEYVNCEPIYTAGECCPKYECSQKEPASLCDPVQCPESCSEVVYANGCPICDCQSLLCAPPKCPSECTLDFNSGSCPTCKCPDSTPRDVKMCAPVQCGPQCREAFGPQGCPICICGSLCSPPNCDPGCHLETFVLEGQCPGCICAELAELTTENTSQAPKVMCAPVKCSSSCIETTGPNGCPMCDCPPLCSPPKCAAGCRLEAMPSSGPCPKCVCDEMPLMIQCAPVKCSENCYEVRIPNGCPMCMCDDVLCSPPICPSGCDIKSDVGPGKCPYCLCPSQDLVAIELPSCDPVVCGPQCHEGTSPNGCPICVCGTLCTPPVCESGCLIQKVFSEGQCPGCECPSGDIMPTDATRDSQIQCGTVKCPKMCAQALGDNGCPTCVCDFLCSPPKCGYGCRLQRATPDTPCPECVCDSESRVPDIACSPPKCDELGCRIDYTAQPCPSCVCDGRVPDILCSSPKCDFPGCKMDYSSKPCPQCVCFSGQVAGIACSPPNCTAPGCHIDYSKLPCPECSCETGIPPIMCSPPKCDDPGCTIDFTTQPCPSCKCDGPQIPLIACSPPICTKPGCHIDYTKKPCPGCACGIGSTRLGLLPIPCSPPKCDSPGCRIDFNTRPCPSCKCDEEQIPFIACSPPKCTDHGCRIDYTKKPCPECVCDGKRNILPIPCSPPKCDDPGCRIDYSARPCPSCVCDATQDSLVLLCSPLKCDDPGCHVDYTKKPCPECVCDGGQGILPIPCSPPKCNDPGCRLDFTAYPCPECVCDAPKMSCSVPKCDGAGCRIYYRRNECPQCVCDSGYIPFISCSMPKCDPECKINYNSSPCPSCDCDKRSVRQIQCSPPRCPRGCRLDYSTRPCPSCACNNRRNGAGGGGVVCSPPTCPPGCYIDSTMVPCPGCNCREPQRACDMPQCGPQCEVDYNTSPCPSCNCQSYQRDGVICSPPICDPGCYVDSTMVPCPGCKCTGNRRPSYWGA